MSAEPLAGLQGASAVQAVEGSCSGAAEGMEISAVPPLHGSCGHPGGLALSSRQRSLPAAACGSATATSTEHRLPSQAEVSFIVKHLVSQLHD